jgi:hypothetical protein
MMIKEEFQSVIGASSHPRPWHLQLDSSEQACNQAKTQIESENVASNGQLRVMCTCNAAYTNLFCTEACQFCHNDLCALTSCGRTYDKTGQVIQRRELFRYTVERTESVFVQYTGCKELEEEKRPVPMQSMFVDVMY